LTAVVRAAGKRDRLENSHATIGLPRLPEPRNLTGLSEHWEDRSGNNQGKLKVGLPCDVGLFGPSYADRKDRFRFLADGGIAGSPAWSP